MVRISKFLACVFAMLVMCTYVEANNRKQAKTYKLESDVINFDYTKLSYPSDCITIGVDTGKNILKERKPGRQPTTIEKVKDIVIGAVKIFFCFLLISFGCVGICNAIPIGSEMAFIIGDIRKKYKEKKKLKEDDTFSEN
jgi:hypothetical protein